MSLLGVVGVLLSLVGGPAVAQDQPAVLPALQVVVLVDESGSIGDADLVAEKEAARTIAASVLAPGSIVSVVGFGSSEKPGQSAVDVVCPPTGVDESQSRDGLAKCVDGLHKRQVSEGAGTDHVAALQQALDTVRSGGPDRKVVFLLTDGVLDVSNSPSWGDTPDRRNRAAAAEIKNVLGALDRQHAQVWPLGFGKVDLGGLAGLAKGTSCTPAAPNPKERVVGAGDLRGAIQDAFRSASCGSYNTSDRGDVPKGGSLDLTVDIPEVASDASIIVYKRDRRVQVEYRAPGSGKPAPAEGGSHFEFAGQSTETESVVIADPVPGRWTIRLSSADVDARDVAAAVFFQAAVKAYLTAVPAQPAAGQTVDVGMQVRARDKAIADPDILRGLTFVVTLTGSSGFPAQTVQLTDPDGDGAFTGQLKVPDGAKGDLTFTGDVSGVGIGGDRRVLSTKVRGEPAAVQGQILFDDNRATVTPGGSITGTARVANNSGAPVRLRFQTSDVTAGTTLTVDPSAPQAEPGNSDIPFTLHFGPGTPEGVSGARLSLVTESDGAVVAERLLATEVAPEPGVFERFFWMWVGLGVLVLAALVFLLLRLRTKLADLSVGGLRVQLRRGGFQVSELVAPDPSARTFGFVVHDDFTGLQLQPAGPDEPNTFHIRRVSGRLEFGGPGVPTAMLQPGSPRAIGPDMDVVILDDRAAAGVNSGPPTDPFATTAHPAGGNGYAGPPVDPFAQTTAVPTEGTSHLDNPFGDSQFPRPANEPEQRTEQRPSPQIDPYNPFA